MRFWYPYHIVEHKGFDEPVQIDLPDSVFATCMYTVDKTWMQAKTQTKH